MAYSNLQAWNWKHVSQRSMKLCLISDLELQVEGSSLHDPDELDATAALWGQHNHGFGKKPTLDAEFWNFWC